MLWSFENPNIWAKIENINSNCESSFKLKSRLEIPDLPARDVQILEAKHHPPKKGLSTAEGQARVLHDLASIELQAMELGLRTLTEFPDAPEGFKEELTAVTVSEAQHLKMCLEGIESLGFKWGDWPIHCALWAAVSAEDSLLDRILIVHRYLEGSGLDAGDGLLKKLESVDTQNVKNIVKQINEEEIGHVAFGSRWYRSICSDNQINANEDFPLRMQALRERLPKRVEKINHELRAKAGFTASEIEYFEMLRKEFLVPYKVRLQAKQEAGSDSQK